MDNKSKHNHFRQNTFEKTHLCGLVLKIMCEKEEKECQETKLDDECKDEDLKDPLDELRKFLKSKFFPDKFIKEIFEKGVTEDIQE